jgi:hypothetical protein
VAVVTGRRWAAASRNRLTALVAALPLALIGFIGFWFGGFLP